VFTAARFSSRSDFEYTSKDTPIPWPRPTRTVQLQRHAIFPLRVGHLKQIDLRHGAGNI